MEKAVSLIKMVNLIFISSAVRRHMNEYEVRCAQKVGLRSFLLPAPKNYYEKALRTALPARKPQDNIQ
jgi:hypothetical protein